MYITDGSRSPQSGFVYSWIRPLESRAILAVVLSKQSNRATFAQCYVLLDLDCGRLELRSWHNFQKSFSSKLISKEPETTYACSKPFGNVPGRSSSYSCSKLVCAKRFVKTSFANKNIPSRISVQGRMSCPSCVHTVRTIRNSGLDIFSRVIA